LPAIAALTLSVAPALHSQQVSTQEFLTSEELNQLLPPWLRFSGEFRTRLEAVTAGSFRDGNDDAYLLIRLRINMTAQPVAWLKFQFQGQDARVFWKNQRPPAPPFAETMDLRIVYLEVGDSEKKSFGLQAGRPELLLCGQRLVGNANWLNAPRVFGAVRLTLRQNRYRVDAFAWAALQPANGESDRPFRNKLIIFTVSTADWRSSYAMPSWSLMSFGGRHAIPLSAIILIGWPAPPMPCTRQRASDSARERWIRGPQTLTGG
jgi:hypothetical protein